jgi:hypothetical protein
MHDPNQEVREAVQRRGFPGDRRILTADTAIRRPGVIASEMLRSPQRGFWTIASHVNWL